MPFKSLTTEEFKNKLFQLVGDEYSEVSGFKRMKDKCVFRHNVCGSLFETSPNNFIYKHCRCKKCRDNTHAKSPEKFKEEFYNKEPENYKLIGSYYRSTVPIKVKHLSCGYEYLVTPKDFLNGRRCPNCYGNSCKTTETFFNEVKELTNGEYELMSAYISSIKNVRIKHLKCGKVYSVKPHDFLQGNRCPHCRESRGEKLIEYTLDSLNIKFTRQKYFDGCSRPLKNSYLRYDFYIPRYNLLIEYDGEQHFHPVKWLGGKQKFEDQRERDFIKNKFAKDNGMTLVRYPYTLSSDELVKNIEKLINSYKAEIPVPKLRNKI